MEGWSNLFGWLLSIITATGNGFVVFLVVKNRRLHCAANWFVLSLAVADFAVGVAVFPSSYLCTTCNAKVYMAFYWFFVHSSVTNLCSLTWNRYTAIVHPLKYITSVSARRPGTVILLAWLIPLAISLSLVIGMYATNSDTAWKVLRLTGVSGFGIISCALLFYAIVRMLIVVRAQSLQDTAMESIKRDLEPTGLQPQQNHSSTETTLPRGRKKHSKAPFIIAIVTFFLGCHIATNYLALRIMFSSEPSNTGGWVVTLLLVTNSAVNPLVYAFLKRDIKKEIGRLICRETRRNNAKIRERLSRSTQVTQSL